MMVVHIDNWFFGSKVNYSLLLDIFILFKVKCMVWFKVFLFFKTKPYMVDSKEKVSIDENCAFILV